ncbi:S-formylglutathione hydrolase [Alteromonas sediminis]|uniref:S-formylglutathione hydrolase n=1 Tax=Alteromonas sediminis TaxID=2259342 RepID=A0A3N5Y2S8_9ALTE|nr:S-formylglutathione hydrolase [Alteromonas sediminis]RPJ68092.1 S-formylglutathione hydrolase [Alteromonas sediminis]
MEMVSETKVWDGLHQQFTHSSSRCQCDMRFAVFLPPQASQNNRVPVVYWLSGLTCTDENFMQKAGAFRTAAELGIAIVAPDTSPRGESVADDESYDLGQGAGFYVNATQAPWSQHFQMYDYITHELPALIEANFPVSNRKSLAGHSMGGHGALVIGLSNMSQYQSISAFSPISNPTQCPWGKKAFTAYLGANQSEWQEYDASHLLANCHLAPPILIDQGDRDTFLKEQLKPETLQSAATKSGVNITLRMQPGYDHSYYFIQTFIDEHLRFHYQYLRQ